MEGSDGAGSEVGVEVNTEEEDKLWRVLTGSLQDLPPLSSKIVRIFTSSTFTGTTHLTAHLTAHLTTHLTVQYLAVSVSLSVSISPFSVSSLILFLCMSLSFSLSLPFTQRYYSCPCITQTIDGFVLLPFSFF